MGNQKASVKKGNTSKPGSAEAQQEIRLIEEDINDWHGITSFFLFVISAIALLLAFASISSTNPLTVTAYEKCREIISKTWVSYVLLILGAFSFIFVAIGFYNESKSNQKLKTLQPKLAKLLLTEKMSRAIDEAIEHSHELKVSNVLRYTYVNVTQWNPFNYRENVLVYDIHEHIRCLLNEICKAVISLDPRFSDNNVTVDMVFQYPTHTTSSDNEGTVEKTNQQQRSPHYFVLPIDDSLQTDLDNVVDAIRNNTDALPEAIYSAISKLKEDEQKSIIELTQLTENPSEDSNQYRIIRSSDFSSHYYSVLNYINSSMHNDDTLQKTGSDALDPKDTTTISYKSFYAWILKKNSFAFINEKLDTSKVHLYKEDGEEWNTIDDSGSIKSFFAKLFNRKNQENGSFDDNRPTYIWDKKDAEYAGASTSGKQKSGSIVGMKIDITNDEISSVLATAILTINTYGEPLYYDIPNVSEEDYIVLFQTCIMEKIKSVLASELAQMYIRHMIRDMDICPYTGRKCLDKYKSGKKCEPETCEKFKAIRKLNELLEVDY